MIKRKIIFIPGKNPKPDPELHFRLLLKCLLAGIAKADSKTSSIEAQITKQFDLCAWNYDFYRTHEDIRAEIAWIDKTCAKTETDDGDLQAIYTYQAEFKRLMYLMADLFPWIIDWVADERIKALLNGSTRYFHNVDGVAVAARQKLKRRLQVSREAGETVLLIAHSMGSVIAYDALYELMQQQTGCKYVDLFLTVGSPLGLKFTQKQLLSYQPDNPESFPDNIKHWKNISARGDLICVDKTLADDFATMLEQGLLDSIEDYTEDVFNWFQNDEGYNPHRSYGYLVTPQLGQIVADWYE